MEEIVRDDKKAYEAQLRSHLAGIPRMMTTAPQVEAEQENLKKVQGMSLTDYVKEFIKPEDMTAMMANSRYSGAAGKKADTFEGAEASFKQAIAEAEKEMGTVILPTFTTWLKTLTKDLQDNAPLFKTLGEDIKVVLDIIGGLAGKAQEGVDAYNKATGPAAAPIAALLGATVVGMPGASGWRSNIRGNFRAHQRKLGRQKESRDILKSNFQRHNNMGSILQTNITQFVEQPGRTIQRTQGGLDKMTAKLLGPYWLADAQRPGQRRTSSGFSDDVCCLFEHHQLQAGGLGEITVNYAGRTDTTGTQNFTSETLVSFSRSEKEVSYQQFYQQRLTIIIPGLAQWKIGTDSYVLKYLTQNVSHKYVTNFLPPGPQFDATGASVVDSWIRYNGRGGGDVTVGNESAPDPGALAFWQSNNVITGTVGPFNVCTQFSPNQVIGPWYECQETWEPRIETQASH